MPEKVYTRFDEDDVPKAGSTFTDSTAKVSAEDGPSPSKRRKLGDSVVKDSSVTMTLKQTKTVVFNDSAGNETRNQYSPGPKKIGQKIGVSQTSSNRGLPSLKRRAQELLPIRQALPVFAEARKVRESLRSPGHDVLLLVGETGSGKSTQVPQILLNEPWAQRSSVDINGKSTKVGGCIAITEPRRVAAISLARRVAEEIGTPLGSSSPASKVGYSVRFDNSTSPSTRIKFLTEGMLLQEMLRDPWLTEYSAVLVDEVHERGVNVDLVLGFLKRMLDSRNEGRGGIPLKIVVMSATADMETVKEFLQERPGSPNGDLNGAHRANCQDHDTDDGSEWSGFSDSEPTHQDSQTGQNTTPARTRVTALHIKGRQFPVSIVYSPSPVPDFIDAALTTIFTIHTREPLPGDILVFLTGQETVENLTSLCHQYSSTLPPNIPKLLILPLFATLPQAAQQQVFQPTPKGRRKVILSTNIAETSVTVPGVRFVIDCGKHKRKQFRSRLSLESLLVKPISKSSARQRAGRAGREAPGTCYRLYTETDYLKLPQDTNPEILRCDLSQAILTLKARSVDDIFAFPFLTPPPREPLEKALLSLLHLSALDPSTGSITPTGLQLARLPLPPRLGRVLLAAVPHAVVAEVIDIIAALSVESIFLPTSTEETTEQATAARRELFRREGDHLTYLATVRAYLAENSDRRAWCEKRFISHRAMQAVVDVRKQLLSHAKSSGLLSSPSSSETAPDNEIEKAPAILKAFLQALHPFSTARLMPDGSYRTFVASEQTVAIHPASTLFGAGKKFEAIMYNECVFTNRAYARGVSAVELRWIGDIA